MEYEAKLNKKYTLTGFILFQVPKLHQHIPFFYIFHHFIQHYLKKSFRNKLLLFLTDSPQPSNLHNSQNLLSMAKAFLSAIWLPTANF